MQAQEIAEQTKLLEQETERYEAIRKTYDAIKAEIRNSHGSINELKKKYQEMEQEIQDKQSAKEEMEEKVHKCESMTAHYQKKIQTIDEVLGKLGVCNCDISINWPIALFPLDTPHNHSLYF